MFSFKKFLCNMSILLVLARGQSLRRPAYIRNENNYRALFLFMSLLFRKLKMLGMACIYSLLCTQLKGQLKKF